MAYYETARFKRMKNAWDTRLEREGFKDCEEEKNGKVYIKDYHSMRFQRLYGPDHFLSTESYYRRARNFLHTYVFQSDLQVKIWFLYSEGISLRKIAQLVRSTLYRVHLIARKLTRIMLEVCPT